MNDELLKSAKEIFGFFYYAMDRFENKPEITNQESFEKFLNQITDEWMRLRGKEVYSGKVRPAGYQKAVERLRERNFDYQNFNSDPEFRRGVLFTSYKKFFDE